MADDRSWLVARPDGRFACPRQLWAVDLQQCLGCDRLLDLDRAGRDPSLQCAALGPAPDGPRNPKDAPGD